LLSRYNLNDDNNDDVISANNATATNNATTANNTTPTL
jgi:hypothetical protein